MLKLADTIGLQFDGVPAGTWNLEGLFLVENINI